MTPVRVSIVVITFNRVAGLADALESLLKLRTDFAYEIVVVDNASTDKTPAVIAEFASKSSVPVRGVHEPKKGVPCARNCGIESAAGEWIAFFDDDQLADENWLAELVALAEEKQARCTGGYVKLKLPDDFTRRLAAPCRLLLSETVGRDKVERYPGRQLPATGNVLIHRSVFKQAGNFDESMMAGGSDSDLFRRVRETGIEMWYTPKAIIHHVIPEHRLTDQYLKWTAIRRGWTMARQNCEEAGRYLPPLSSAARFAQAWFLRCPQLVMAKLRGDREAVLGVKCQLWRTEGYIRSTFNMLLPWAFPQAEFFKGLEHRAQRKLFAKGSA